MASSPEPLAFRVDEDVPDDPVEEGGMGQMQHLLYVAESLVPEDRFRFQFEDVDGEEVFLLASAVSLLSVPLWVIEPTLLESRMEALDEDEEAETDE